ncbi:MAG: gliding motility-associated C-terminal domain-containing protein [Bacteroidales bacterium]|nr:gliding motility-associated C-terminal domain-containing protein [Bacteroidales bacterium]
MNTSQSPPGRNSFPLILIILCLLTPATHQAQRPCQDTLVRIFDTICEGDTLHYRGRILDHPGLFFDTIPRTDTICDSIIILKLSVLTSPGINIYPIKHCTPIIAYDLLGGYPQITYYRWSSEPFDSTLIGQEHLSRVRVNPRQPTTYTLRLDYREDPPQCPGTATIEVIPIEPVTAAMHVTPDEITYDNMHIIAEDFSTGTRENHWGGWAGRHWYINGERQPQNGEWVEFYGDPSWGDTVHLMMEAYTPTCLDTAYRDIPFRRVAIYIPNVFTPGAETNNTIQPLTTGVTDFQMWIYDRQGTLIIHLDDRQQSWDGTAANGHPCPQGTYTYYYRYRDAITPTGDKSATGTITLLR